MRRLAVAQLGSYGVLNEKEFTSRVVDYAIRVSTPKALRIAADITEDTRHRDALRAAANRCENEGTRESADAAYAATVDAATADTTAAYAAAYAASSVAYAAYASHAASSVAYATHAAHAAASAAYAAAAAYAGDVGGAAASAARDKSLSEYAEVVVQILIAMKAPGCKWLPLTEIAGQ